MDESSSNLVSMDGSSSFVPLRKRKKEEQSDSGEKRRIKQLPSSIHGEKLRNQYRIEVDGADIPDPIVCFEEMTLPQRIFSFLKRTKHFSKPTPIQMQAIGCLIRSRDVICLSPTGSGKTYGYLLPLCSFLWRHRASFNTSESVKPLCLILVPTRELMHQVCGLTKELVENLNIPITDTKPVMSHNGASHGHQPYIARTHSTMTSQDGSGHGKYSSHNTWNQSTMVYSQHPQYQENSTMYQQNPNMMHHHNHPTTNQGQISPNMNTINNYHSMMTQGHMYQQFSHGNYQECPPQQRPPPFSSQQYGYSAQNNSLLSSSSVNSFVSPSEQHCHSALTRDSILNSVVVGICGGVQIKEDLKRLTPKTKVLISTPGRLLDLCERGEIDLQEVCYFVIDECDRSLEMGMEEQLRKIVAMVTVNEKTSLQTSLWSATLPESLERLARSAVVDPLYICSGVKDTIPVNITQNVLFVHTYQKDKVLLDLLRKTPYPPVIVFTSSRDKADEVTGRLQGEQFHAAAMHSAKDQTYRNNVMDDFRGNRIDVLVATDLVSRGLDIPAVTHVIHYDTPDTIEDYIHRSGRTGRFGRQGQTSTLLTLDCKIAQELKELLETSKIEIPPQLKDTKMFGKKVIHTEMGDRIV